ncbi:MAG: type II secretion system minor pseudopilin GspI [Burkholderiaceae bacterium]
MRSGCAPVGETTGRRSPRGFTLIEVLVALTIAAIALLAAMRAGASLINGTADLRARTFANWSAENRLSEVRMLEQWPDLGERRFECGQGGVALECVERVFATPNRFFRRVEINVLDGDGHRLAQLTGFATRLQ